MQPQTKIYPTTCQSSNCGSTGQDCLQCKNFPELTKFKKWVKETEAIQEDPIWYPSYWIATKE